MYFTSLIYMIPLITYISGTCQRTYSIPEVNGTRFQAHQICKSRGTTLLSVENEEEENNFLSYLQDVGEPGEYYWISGLSYWKQQSSRWWFDNNGRMMTYDNWCIDYGQPQEQDRSFTYREPCVAANFRGEAVCWHDYPCFTKLHFVCATPCESDVTIPFVQYGEFCVRLDVQLQTKAAEKCKEISRDKTLINLDSPKKVEKLFYYLSAYSKKSAIFWVGLKRSKSNPSRFHWDSGLGEVAKWIKWKKGAPMYINWECVIGLLGNSTIWIRDVACDPYIKYYYVCE